ncbi:MAG TPA: vWA domain-containing protein [Pirellulaceae bacterium]|jgi:hypothetical protein|nr:vWA domain-containing protein [Pirellulaceae bacterium]
MDAAVQHADLVSLAWPTILVVPAALAALSLWIASHFLGRFLPGRVLKLVAFVARFAIGAFALWLACSALSRFVSLMTSWSIPAICLLIAVAVEAVVWLYRRERDFVSPTKGIVLTSLRAALLVVLGAMLLQPEFVWSIPHRLDRYVAVLLDDSESMQLVDQQLTASEKLRLVRAFEPDVAPPPYDLASVAGELDREAGKLSAAAEGLQVTSTLTDASAETDFRLRQASIDKSVQEAKRVAQRQVERLDDLTRINLQLPADLLASFDAEKKRLESEVIGKLTETDRTLGEGTLDAAGLGAQLEAAAAAIREASAKLPGLVDGVDRAFYASLPPETTQKVDALVARSRADIARAVLLAQNEKEGSGLLDKIQQGYEVRLFRFDGEVAEVDVAEWSSDRPATTLVSHKPAETSAVEEAPGPDAAVEEVPAADADAAVAAAPKEDAHASRRVTDLAGALERVRKEIPRESLAGVLLVTDGRNTAPSDVEAAAGKLAGDGVQVSALAVGSSRPPVNASIVDVESPETVMAEDMLPVEVRLKLTGMKGRTVRAKLFDGEEVVAERTLDVAHDDFATSVRLEHSPETEGLKEYRVALEPVGADAAEKQAFSEDDERSFSVAVTDDRTEILLLEGRPRWEYNYLRNLFAGRDARVQLQTVLFQPDRLEGQGDRPRVFASASREANEVEATHAPENEAEWLKFDVIILGDVGREHLTDEMLKHLHTFVHRRGGALVVIAGPQAMPHRYVDTPLAEMLPFQFAPTQEAQFASPEESFRIRLTPNGVRHAIMRQADTSEASVGVWDQVPAIDWRHALISAKAGAAVLAYAGDPEKEKDFDPRPGDEAEAAEARRVLRDAYQKERALIAIQNFGSGRVMGLNTDRTWRLRYRVGDERHHRFWGQAVRWAAGEKLQSGTQFVQLGADRVRYEMGQPVQVTVKLTDPFFEPIDDKKASVKLYRGDELALTVPLAPIPEAPGSYRAEIGVLPKAGAYRLALDSPEVKRVFAGQAEETVESTITVDAPQTVSRELIDPTADRAALQRIAAKAQGVVVEADDAEGVLGYFAEGSKTIFEIRSIVLWDGWPLLGVLVSLVTAEWIVRKTGGLV